MASVRGKAAALVASSGFMEHVAALLKTAPAVHVDETPARAGGGTRYVHLACTRYLSHLHTGTRSADDTGAGGVLPGYSGIIVRDGYAGYASRCTPGARVHLLRDLKAPVRPRARPAVLGQDMAGLLIEARDAAAAAPSGAARPPWKPPSLERSADPLPGPGRRRADHQPLPAHRHRQSRPPLPAVSKTPYPAICHPPRPGHLQQRSGFILHLLGALGSHWAGALVTLWDWSMAGACDSSGAPGGAVGIAAA